MIKSDGLLYIEPQGAAADQPVIDETTRKMAAAYAASTPSEFGYRGFHMCACSATSDNRDHYLADGTDTNSLCVHYLAFHRPEVPQFQLDKVAALDVEGIEPTAEMLGTRRLF
jgi:hypothetical protein